MTQEIKNITNKMKESFSDAKISKREIEGKNKRKNRIAKLNLFIILMVMLTWLVLMCYEFYKIIFGREHINVSGGSKAEVYWNIMITTMVVIIIVQGFICAYIANSMTNKDKRMSIVYNTSLRKNFERIFIKKNKEDKESTLKAYSYELILSKFIFFNLIVPTLSVIGSVSVILRTAESGVAPWLQILMMLTTIFSLIKPMIVVATQIPSENKLIEMNNNLVKMIANNSRQINGSFMDEKTVWAIIKKENQKVKVNKEQKKKPIITKEIKGENKE
ncbi:hypothetical protein [Mycoplasma todarodis]|uniref:Uncharacterized protein n=1 Tax=Mycoplasma todarodis TaxID=1937191 RepID=A0A4R0XPC0_9MOLU|nr:hypothetical protein [Mycoplasma todarodis]TCG10745.1 hypothetical protein C4B25_03115 [Mycoplasma todarodis]